MVTVGYDFQIFGVQRRGGISRYFCELMRQFADLEPFGVDVRQGWRFNGNLHAQAYGCGRPSRVADQLSWRYARRMYKLLARPHVDVVRSAEVLHPTYYERPLSRLRRGQAAVVTVHDMIPEAYPELFRANPHRFKQQHVATCDHIVAVSEATKSELLRFCGDPGVPISVVHHGVDAAFFAERSREAAFGDIDDFVLFVGDRGGYKQFRTLLRAFSQVRHLYKFLIAAGGGPLTSEECTEISKMDLGDRVLQVSPDDLSLRSLYQQAAAFVFPSVAEGFGLPTLEAMSAGCSVILARCSSHPEVGGSAALYFEPSDPQDLRDVLVRLHRDDHLKRDLRTRGPARARAFSWSDAATKTAEVYQSLAPVH
jgi:glycosyltransferase involved in cell wall biosynthesis